MKTIVKSAVVIAVMMVMNSAQAADGKAVYSAACALCHTTGAMAAPKTGDKAAWAILLKKGVDTLYESSIKGRNAMPAKGGKSQFSDAEVKAAVDYMISQSK